MTILITGGTRGIGYAIAKHLAKKGETLFLVYHSDGATASKAKTVLTSQGAEVHLIQADVGSKLDCQRVMDEIKEESGQLDHIVHSAAMIYPTGLLDADLDKFTNAIETNGLSLLYLVQMAQPLLRRGSSIVFISSLGSRVAPPGLGYAALGAGKALAETIILYLVPELAPLGIRINTVAPGITGTQSVATMLGSKENADAALARSAKANPSGRNTEGSDYTSLVEFLLQPEAEFIQGQVIAATGGMGLIR